MGLFQRAFKFTAGGLTGAAVGATVAVLLAPESGQDLQRSIRERIRAAKIAGAEAKAAKEAELVRKFRVEVSDPAALRDLEEQTKLERAQALKAIESRSDAPAS